ncbi:MAG: hypothetical protein ACTSUN_08080 [Promethearchaeota archaeon]
MSKDIKNLIDKVEEEAKMRIELEKKIEALNEEIVRLKSIIEEQNALIEQQDKMSSNIPPDVAVLKDMIMKKRQELEEKDKEIEELQNELLNLKEKGAFTAASVDSESLSEELENAKALILQLTEENKLYKLNEEQTQKIVKNLMEKNEEYKKEIELLKAKSEITATATDPAPTPIPDSKEIKRLKEENEDYKSQIISLKERIELLESSITSSTSGAEDELKRQIDSLREENAELKKENFLLKKRIEKMKVPSEKPEEISREPIKKEYEEFIADSMQKEGAEVVEEITVKPSEILAKQKAMGKVSEEIEPIKEESMEVAAPPKEMKEVSPPAPPIEITPEIESKTIPPLKTSKEILVVSEMEGHRRCPKCGNTNRNKIHEELDKSHIIMAYPRMYGKKYRCGNCGCEWKIRQE